MAQRVKEEELQRLKRQIKEWNENRLDLFELSQPNEVFISLPGSLRQQCVKLEIDTSQGFVIIYST